MADPKVLAILADVLRDEASGTGRPLPMLLCRTAARDLAVHGAGLWIVTGDGVQQLVAATDGLARSLEELQFTTGEGPCLDAYTARRPVLQPDLAAQPRWPVFGPAALAAGAAAVFSFPLAVGDIRVGVLDLYRTVPGDLSPSDTTDALAFADAATILMLYLQQRSGPELNPELELAWTGHNEVHQATGMVAVQAGVSLAQALLLMRARAYAEDRSIGAVADDILGRTLRFDTLEQTDDEQDPRNPPEEEAPS